MEEQQQNNKQVEEQQLEEQKKQFFDYLKNLVQLRGDIDTKSIKETIYEDMVFKGPTVWILICSILIASIGLNVSSTAVVIGAMLISPLMSPIVAIGLAVGTYNWPKLVKALKNFAVMIVVSLITSYIYFLISPLKIPSAEIIARTEPTLLDVFIGIIGGVAGIIAISRKDISNVIPGVAIATALMPPLCTAGFGLATLNFQYFGGAFYLFILNSIMIALATYMVVTYLRFPNYKYLDQKRAKKLKRYITIFIIAIMIPSVIVFYNLIKSSSYNRSAEQFFKEVTNVNGNRLLKPNLEYSGDTSTMELVYFNLDAGNEPFIRKKFETYHFPHTRLVITDASKSADELLNEILSDRDKEERLRVLEQNTEVLNTKIKESRDSLLDATKRLARYEHFNIPLIDLENELKALFPEVNRLLIANIVEDSKGELNKAPCIIIDWSQNPSKSQRDRISAFCKTRLKTNNLIIKDL